MALVVVLVFVKPFGGDDDKKSSGTDEKKSEETTAVDLVLGLLEPQGGEIRVEICSNCHPFYTGKQKQASTGGRVERFNKRFGAAVKRG